jgi:hypothetical protein
MPRYCRDCGKMPKEDEFWDWFEVGLHDIICSDCVKKMYAAAKKKRDNDK